MAQFFDSTRKWAAYDTGDFTFLQDDFVHTNPVQLEVRYRTDKAKIQIEEKLTQKEAASSHGAVQFQLPLTSNQEQKLYSRITSNGKCTLAYDNGLLELTSGTKLNFFSSFQTNRSFTNNVYKFGLACLGESYNYGFRFRYEAAGKNNLLLHLKGSSNGDWHHGRWRLNFFNIFDPAISKCIKNGVLLGLFLDGRGEDNIFFRLESGRRRQTGLQFQELFSHLKINWTRMVNPNTKVGFQTKFNFGNQEHAISHTYIGAEWKFPSSNTTFKARISPLLTTALAITHNLGTVGSYSLGMELKEMGKENSLRFGTRIEINL